MKMPKTLILNKELQQLHERAPATRMATASCSTTCASNMATAANTPSSRWATHSPSPRTRRHPALHQSVSPCARCSNASEPAPSGCAASGWHRHRKCGCRTIPGTHPGTLLHHPAAILAKGGLGHAGGGRHVTNSPVQSKPRCWASLRNVGWQPVKAWRPLILPSGVRPSCS